MSDQAFTSSQWMSQSFPTHPNADVAQQYDLNRQMELLRGMATMGVQTSPTQNSLGEHSLSPSKFATMFGSKLNLIQEGDETAETSGEHASQNVDPQIGRLLSNQHASGNLASAMRHVASHDRLSEHHNSMDDGDIYGSLGGRDLRSNSGESDRISAPYPASQAPPIAPMIAGQAGAQPPALPGDMPAGDNLSRTLFVRNIDSSVVDEDLYSMFEAYGEIRTLYTACKHRGFVVISYYDLRAACLAVHMLNGNQLHGRSLDIRFSAPKDFTDSKEALQGTVLVFLTDPSLSEEELFRVFAGFGDVKGITDAGKPNHKAVEFYDVRHAASALKSLNRADVAKRLIVFEASSPTPVVPQDPTWSQPMDLPQQRLSHALSTNALTAHDSMREQQQQQAVAARGLLRNMSESSLAQVAAAGGSVNDLLQLAGLQQQQQQPLQQHQPDQLLGQAAMYNQHGSKASLINSMSTGNLAGHLSQLQHSASTDNLVPSLYNASLLAGQVQDAALVSQALQAGLLQRPHNLPMSMSTGNLGALGSSRMQAPQPAPMGGLRGIASTGNLWNTAQQMLANQSPWSGSMPNLQATAQQGGLSDWQLQQAAALQGLSLQGLQQSASVDNLLAAAQGLPGGAAGLLQHNQLSAAQHLLQQAVNVHSAQSAAAGYPLGGNSSMRMQGVGAAAKLPAGAGRGAKDRRDDTGGLGGPGGRLSRRNLDPVAEAERKAQQEKLYALELDKICHGHDKRTTLMIKNIPNKYTQKMLLATIDEKFRGTYDFFYLPIDFKNKCNVGYAFINLILPEYIVPLVERFNNKKWEKFNSEKICNISYARIQGKSALVAHFQNSSLLHEDKRCRPILFHSEGPFAGDQEPFPMKPVTRGMGSRSSSRGSMNQLSSLAGPSAPSQPPGLPSRDASW